MFHPIVYDEQSRTYLARFSGTLTDQDMAASDVAARKCLALHGPTAGLLDFSYVVSCALTSAQTAARGSQPEIMVGQKRAIVANAAVYGMMRMFHAYQPQDSVAPMILRTLPEAYAALGLVERDFHPVALDLAH